MVICCGISNIVHTLLQSRNIRIIAGRVGEIDAVVEAFLCGQLDDQCFLMPGYKSES